MVRVCFVCLGNICRSPTAEGVLRHLVAEAGLSEQVRVESAGTAAYHEGEPADARSRAVASARGIALTSVARRFEPDDFDRYDYVLAMDRENRDALRALAPDETAAARVGLLRDHGGAGSHEQDVPDPYYGGEGGFDEVFDICESACRALLARIRERHAL